MGARGNIQPYMFEPKRSTSRRYQRLQEEPSPEAPTDDHSSSGEDGLTWCTCGECVAVATRDERVCCDKSKNIKKLKGSSDCIVQHDSFYSVVLNRDVLESVRQRIRVRSKPEIKERYSNQSNNLMRHLAYTQLVHWVNGWQSKGKNIRFAIPSCVVNLIRMEYPSPNNTYTGLQIKAGQELCYFD